MFTLPTPFDHSVFPSLGSHQCRNWLLRLSFPCKTLRSAALDTRDQALVPAGFIHAGPKYASGMCLLGLLSHFSQVFQEAARKVNIEDSS